MIWIICEMISAVMIALSIRAYLDKNNGSLRVIFVLACLFIATYIITYGISINSSYRLVPLFLFYATVFLPTYAKSRYSFFRK